MALPEISTGYKPEFGLGALYQGYNAGNADASAQEEIIKQYLANQKAQQMDPLDIQVRQWDAAHAQDKLKDDAYRKAAIDGYIGQMNSQIAAGKKAMGTVDSDVALSNQTSKNELWDQQLLQKLHDLRNKRLEGSSSIGFPMQAGDGQYSDPAGNGDLVKTSGQPLLMANRQNVNKNNSPITPQPPQRQNAMYQGSPEEEQIMAMLVDNPKFRQQMSQLDVKQDSAEYMKMLQLQMAIQAAALRQGNKEPDSAEKILSRLDMKVANGIPLTDDEKAVYQTAAQRRQAQLETPRIQPGNTINPAVAPDVLVPKPAAAKVPTANSNSNKPDPLGIR